MGPWSRYAKEGGGNNQVTLELSLQLYERCHTTNCAPFLDLGKHFPLKYPLGSLRTGTPSDRVTRSSPGGLRCWDVPLGVALLASKKKKVSKPRT